MQIADIPLVFFGAVIALCLWTALALMILHSRHHNHWLKRFGLMLVTLNGALMWTTSALMRVTGNLNPLFINNWSRVFFAMFAFYVLGFAWLSWWVPRKERRRDE